MHLEDMPQIPYPPYHSPSLAARSRAGTCHCPACPSTPWAEGHAETVQLIADAMTAAGHNVTIQDEEQASHIGWGNKFVDDGPIAGVQRLLILDTTNREVIAQVTVDTEDHPENHFNMGYALNRPGRTLSTRWRIAEGYVNGFPIRDIIWYAATRYRRNRRFYKREQAKLSES